MADDTSTGEPTEWNNGAPFNPRFQDRYFDAAGADESAYVFLRHNDLPARWRLQRLFTIGELGFGTGLNACLTFDAWIRHAPSDATLDYVSVEAFPLSPADMLRTALQWPALTDCMRALATACEDLKPGFNLRVLAGGRIRLLLLIGEAQTMLDALDAAMDAWFLDGFAPSRNPAMWSASLCQSIADKTKPGGSFATYTAAGWVRRNLESAGFAVKKMPGFGRKRDMLCGHLPTEALHRHPTATPWFQRPAASTSQEVTVVGAGLAGAATARALAERGFQVTVIDDPAPVRAAPSRLPGLIVRSYPERATNLRGRFYDNAFAHAVHRLIEAPGWHPTGVAVLDVRGHGKASTVAAHDLSAVAGRTVCAAGQWLPRAGWLAPHTWTEAWLEHAAIERVTRRWADPDANDQTPLILATGSATTLWDEQCPVRISRGQLSRVAAPQAHTGQAALAGGGLCIPTAGEWIMGSSHVRENENSQPSPAEAASYVAQWNQQLGDTIDLDAAAAVHTAAIRAGTIDRMPQVGPVPDARWYDEHYAELRHGRPHQVFPTAQYQPGQWLHRGHGSRGATAALLCGEVIAAALAGAPLPVDASTWAALHPGRQLIQALRRGAPSTARAHGQSGLRT